MIGVLALSATAIPIITMSYALSKVNEVITDPIKTLEKIGIIGLAIT